MMRLVNFKFGCFLVTSFLMIKLCNAGLECRINIEGNSTSPLQKTSCEIKSGEENCKDDALERQYPDLFNQRLFPAEPENMTVLPFEKTEENKHIYFPGGNIIIWPTIYSSMRDIKGFFVYIHRQAVDSCVILTFNGTITPDIIETGLNFSISLWPFATKKLYSFKSYSLPKPTGERYDKFQVAYLNTSGSWLSGNGAANWTTMITYRNLSGSQSMSVQVSFSKAPSDLGIEKYHVKLFRILSGTNLLDEKKIKVYEVLISETSYVFTNINDPGWYRVQVLPNGSKKCKLLMCYTTKSCESCLATNTPRFLLHLEDNNVPTVPVPDTNPSTSNSDITTATFVSITYHTGGTKLSVTEQVLISISSVFIVGIICGVLCCFLRSHCQGDDCIGVLNKTRNLSTTVLRRPINQNLNNHPDVGINTKRKSVFLVHADDNKYHSQVVQMFATYLMKHCMCEVLYHPWCTIDKFRWILNALEKADITIMVASEAAFHQYQNWKYQKKSSQNSNNDYFLPAFRQISACLTSKPNFGESLLSVKFDYTLDEHVLTDICFCGQYNLLQQLPDLILRIQGKKALEGNFGRCLKPNLSSTSEGKALAEAVKIAKKHMQEPVRKHVREEPLSLNPGHLNGSSNSGKHFEEGLEYVRKKYLQENSQDTEKDIKMGIFSINPDECSLFNDKHDPSICPAVTILEGNLEGDVCEPQQYSSHEAITQTDLPKTQQYPIYRAHKKTDLPKAQYSIHGAHQQSDFHKMQQYPIHGVHRQTDLPKTQYLVHGVYEQADFPRIPLNEHGISCGYNTNTPQLTYPCYPADSHSNPYSQSEKELLQKTCNSQDLAHHVSEDSVSLGFVGSGELFRSEDIYFNINDTRNEISLSSGYEGSYGLQENSTPEDHEFIAPECLSDSEDICSRVLELQMKEVNQRYDQHLARENSDSLSDRNSPYDLSPLNCGIDKVGLNIECKWPPNGDDFYAPYDDSSIEDNAEVTSLGGYSI